MKSEPQPSTLIEFGPFSFDKALGKLSKQGTSIQLRGMPLQILQHLVARPGEAVRRGELQSLLWNGTAFGDFEQGLNSAVNVVRKTLNDWADQPRYIQTLRGHGYRFIAPLRSALDSGSMVADANQGVENAAEIREAPVGRKATALRAQSWIAATLVIAALGGGAWWKFRPKPQLLIDG